MSDFGGKHPQSAKTAMTYARKAAREKAVTLTVHAVGTMVIDGEALECAVLTGDRAALRAIGEHLYRDVKVQP